MHLLEKYALGSGAKIGFPDIQESFFPTPENYIVLHPSSGAESKNYDYYSDVISLLKPYFDKRGIKIVQIGVGSDPKYAGCDNLNGATTLRQTAFIIKNAKLVLGNDSFSAHVASGFGVKTVTLYSCSPKEDCYPYWTYETDKSTCIEPDRKGEKPSYSGEENPKTINRIDPFRVAKATLDALGIKNHLSGKKSLHIGDLYKQKVVEVVPDFNPLDYQMDRAIFNIRMDYAYDPRLLALWSKHYQISVITDRAIPEQVVKAIKTNTQFVFYKVSLATKPEDLRVIENEGINLICVCDDKENIRDIRLNLIDWKIEEEEVKSKKDYDFANQINESSRYISSKILLSGGERYFSKSDWVHGAKGRSGGMPIIDCDEFWDELDHFRIFNEQ